MRITAARWRSARGVGARGMPYAIMDEATSRRPEQLVAVRETPNQTMRLACAPFCFPGQSCYNLQLAATRAPGCGS